MLIALKRVIRTGSIGFVRNAYVSFAAIFVITVTLLVIGASMIFGHLLEATLTNIKDRVDINVYFVTTASEESILAYKISLEGMADVREVEYTSREAALTQFVSRHENDQLTMAALKELGDNPLGASLSIRAKDPSQYEYIAKAIDSEMADDAGTTAFIDRVNFNQNKDAIDRLSTIIDTIDRITYILTIVLICITVLITLNTVRLAIYTAKEEISVMRLVGANNMFIRGPFIAQGVIYGFISGVLALSVLYPVTYYLGPGTEAFFGVNIFNYYIGEFGRMFSIIVGSGIGLGVVSSILAISRYLRI